MRKKYFVTILIVAFGFLFFTSQKAFAKFETTITREYYLQDDFSVMVKETEVIKNNTSNLYVPGGAKKDFEILAIETGNLDNPTILQKALDSLSIKANGQNISYTSKIQKDIASISTNFPAAVSPGGSVTFVMEYRHPGMLETNGALKDFFVNGFAVNSTFEDASNSTNYETLVFVPINYPDINFINLSYQERQSGNYKVYSFSKEDMLGNYLWIQFGRTQYYKFEIIQNIKKSERLNTGNLNRYEIVIPRNIMTADIDQKIYYEAITPEPEWIKQDSQGNLIASFKLKSNFDGNITIKGYASINKVNDLEIANFGNLSEIGGEMNSYLAKADYWEVDHPTIQNQAKVLKSSNTDIAKLVLDTYNFVIDKIDYSDVKRFGLNERQGAVATLQGGAAVCMEYSDLFLTLMRAQGVPARAAFGYGYDPKSSSDTQESHQWVEIYAPKIKQWVAVDVTWGENGPALIGGDMNHFYTHVASISPNEPPAIVSVGYGILDLEVANYNIEVIESLPEGQYTLQEDLLVRYKFQDESLSDNLSGLLRSKVEATYSNLLNRQKLSLDQILALFFVAMLVLIAALILFATIQKIRKKVSKSELEQLQ